MAAPDVSLRAAGAGGSVLTIRVIRVTPGGRVKSAGEIFIGDVDTQSVVSEESPDVRLTEVHFRNGARNRPHVHSTDQILVCTEGEGFVAMAGEEHDLRPGDVAHIPVTTRHWHGARPGRDMTHWSILGASKTTIVD